jgi:hypothetical protein
MASYAFVNNMASMNFIDYCEKKENKKIRGIRSVDRYLQTFSLLL